MLAGVSTTILGLLVEMLHRSSFLVVNDWSAWGFPDGLSLATDHSPGRVFFSCQCTRTGHSAPAALPTLTSASGTVIDGDTIYFKSSGDLGRLFGQGLFGQMGFTLIPFLIILKIEVHLKSPGLLGGISESGINNVFQIGQIQRIRNNG